MPIYDKARSKEINEIIKKRIGHCFDATDSTSMNNQHQSYSGGDADDDNDGGGESEVVETVEEQVVAQRRSKLYFSSQAC